MGLHLSVSGTALGFGVVRKIDHRRLPLLSCIPHHYYHILCDIYAPVMLRSLFPYRDCPVRHRSCVNGRKHPFEALTQRFGESLCASLDIFHFNILSKSRIYLPDLRSCNRTLWEKMFTV